MPVQPSHPVALVMGDIDLVQALALGGIRSALFALPDSSARRSRHTMEALPWIDHWREPERVVDALLAYAIRRPERPVLLPQTDGDLFVASRFRDRLRDGFHLSLAEAPLVEALVDKAAFASLAGRLGLPTPAAQAVDPRTSDASDLDLRPPLVVKPLVRDSARWSPVEPAAKARAITSQESLRRLWPQLAELGLPVLVQEAVPGPESSIESYHAYIDDRDEVAGHFTGRKIRTLPAVYGHSTAVEITDQPDVYELGREVLGRVGLRGVAKADFKRDPDGRLWLLEVNPRFTLWAHPAAVAGVNLAALVVADLLGRPRPLAARARAGVRWVLPLEDARAARADGVPLHAWLRWAVRCQAISGFSRTDPLPLLAEAVWEPLQRRLFTAARAA